MDTLTYVVPAMGDIYSVSQDAINYAKKHVTRGMTATRVQFVFNGIHLEATSSSNPEDIARQYLLHHQINRLKAGYRD